MRFLTITCNAAIDTTYLVNRLTPGEIHRVERVLPAPGGKGNNVARVLARLGNAPVATGFAGGYTGRFIQDGLRAEGVEPVFVESAGASRVCLTVVEQEYGRITEIREPGSAVSSEDVEQLVEVVAQLAASTDVAVISGSLPPGAPPDTYQRLIDVLKTAGVFVALDSSGDALHSGASAGPDLIKPNGEELSALLGEPASGDELLDAARTHLLGPVLPADSAVLLSMGADGAALIRRERILQANAPRIRVANTVGSGDSLLAGFLHARATALEATPALAFAVATGTAAALQPAVGSVDLADIERLRPLVIVSTIGVRSLESEPATA